MTDRDMAIQGHLAFALYDLQCIFDRYAHDMSIPRFVVTRKQLEDIEVSIVKAMSYATQKEGA